MFDKAILREPFERLFEKAVKEVGLRKENKDHDIDLIKATVQKLVEDLVTERFEKIKAAGKDRPDVLKIREEKVRKTLLDMLEKRIKKIRSAGR